MCAQQEDGDGDLSQEVGDIVDFAVFSSVTQRTHRGRIERIPVHELAWQSASESDGGMMVVGSHRLWVDDCLIPEYADNTPTAAAYYSSSDNYQVGYDLSI